MIAIVSLLFIILFSLVVTRVATVALTLTGLSEATARFQSRSAFTGCGFSTHESEQIMSHPVRRRIVMMLMLLGNAGIVTAVSSFVLAFVTTSQGDQLLLRLAVLAAGIVMLGVVASSSYAYRQMSRIIRWVLQKWTDVQVKDYASLLRLADDYTVAEIRVEEGDWVAGQPLSDLQLSREGVTVLGIQRPDTGYVGLVTGETVIHPNDLLILYGRLQAVNELDVRRSGLRGDRLHEEAVAEETTRIEEQMAVEEAMESESRTEDGTQETP